MNLKIYIPLVLVLCIAAGIVYTNKFQAATSAEKDQEPDGDEVEERSAAYLEARSQYEFNMLKNPVTGTIPAGIAEQELALARTLPVRTYDDFLNNAARGAAANAYIPAGPNNVGGRTRAVLYDRRFNGASNRVIISGCVSGGIMRSVDGGSTWVKVSPENEIHNLTALAQDPLNPDTWYAGGGEAFGNSTTELGAPYLGFGIYKSTDNGINWTKLTLNIIDINGAAIGAGTLEAFDHPFDYTHTITINPVNSDIYIAGHRRIIRSTNGGASFQVVFASVTPTTSAGGQMDIAITNTGRVYVAVNGGHPDGAIRGVWYSNSGNQNSYTRIAGGSVLGVDSIAGWRGNDYIGGSKRILISLAPSNNNIAYVYHENGLSSSSPTLKPEADLYRVDIAGTAHTWSNRSANMPDFPGGNATGSDPLTVQGGYDMEVTVKPDNANMVFISGTNLYRSTDGFATASNTAWIGGYNNNFGFSQYPNSHPDVHRLVFNPSNPAQAICGNDGGIQQTTDIAAATVTWAILPNYQTLQCYNVAIDPGAGRNNFASGSQDNGVRFRDKTGVLGTVAQDSNNHRLLFSADGAFVGISADNAGTQYLYESIQLGRLYRARLTTPFTGGTEITPANLTASSATANPNEFGEFVTNLRVESDNTDNLYYVNFNRLFRTTSASTVTSGTWTELTGVSNAVNPANPSSGRDIGIRGIGFSRGPYLANHVLYFGTTNGKIFRLDDPRNAAGSTVPVNITPLGLVGNVQDIAVNPNNDNEVMAVVSNYGTAAVPVVNIWLTKNGKAALPTWKNAEGNLTLPSIRSCAITVKKDATNQAVTEYYVGTSVGLYSTTNLSATLDANGAPIWQREGGNVLNFAVVSSLAYRPVDNVLLVGTHGNGMYYTYLGTPNFAPNGVVVTPPPTTGSSNFITAVYPTLSAGSTQYQVGTVSGVTRINIQLVNMQGQVVYRATAAYQNGTVPLFTLARGVYLLTISTEDGKNKFVQKIMKQ